MPDRGDDMSEREIERQIAEMRREKIKMEDNIRRLEANSKRIFGEDNPRRNPAYAAAASANEEDDKKKKHDKKTTVNDDEEEEDKDKEDKDKDNGEAEKKDDDDKDEKKEKKRSRSRSSEGRKKRRTAGLGGMKPDARGGRLFGRMLGHLQSAKSRIDTDKGSKAQELRQKATERAEERVQKDKVNLQELRKRGFEQQKEDEKVKVAMIEKQIDEKELLLLQRKLESHYGHMMNFIRTQAEPTIFFLPAKHNKETESKLEETRAAIKHKIASLKVQLKEMPEMPDEEDPEVVARNSAAAAALAAAEGGTPLKASKVDDDDKSEEESIPDKDKKDDDDEDKKEAEDGDKDDDEKKKGSEASGSESDGKD